MEENDIDKFGDKTNRFDDFQLYRNLYRNIDGRGYPDGLKGKEIPLGARILAVTDAYESMVSDRPYRKALPFEDAVAEIRRCSASQFDPDMARAFRSAYESGKIEKDASAGASGSRPR